MTRGLLKLTEVLRRRIRKGEGIEHKNFLCAVIYFPHNSLVAMRAPSAMA